MRRPLALSREPEGILGYQPTIENVIVFHFVIDRAPLVNQGRSSQARRVPVSIRTGPSRMDAHLLSGRGLAVKVAGA